MRQNLSGLTCGSGFRKLLSKNRFTPFARNSAAWYPCDKQSVETCERIHERKQFCVTMLDAGLSLRLDDRPTFVKDVTHSAQL